MAAENEREPAARGRGRGGRGGRAGRGRGGRGASNNAAAGVAKAANNKSGRGGTRRGRAKSFADSRVQAAYERQRDLKATYQTVSYAIKNALQELADRSIDEVLRNFDLDEYEATGELQQRLEQKLALFERQLQAKTQLAKETYDSAIYVTEQEFELGFEDLADRFIDGQLNRVRIIGALRSKDLPIDISDDQYEYKVISDEHFDKEFGIYESYKDGYLVPYPSRVEGTEMWQRARDAEAATAAAAAAAAASSGTRGGRGGRARGGVKRRAQDQPEGQPTVKKTTRSNFESQPLPTTPITPAKGLLATEIESHTDGAPVEEDSGPVTPEPVIASNGVTPVVVARSDSKLGAHERSPPLPKNISDADEYGCRMYNQRPSAKERGANSRLLVPRLFTFEDYEIGFRDSTNDSSKGHTHAKRGKYLDTPDSNGMHFDYWCNGYDYSNTTPSDFDRELVKKHGLHPRFGVFLPTSTNEQEPTKPYVMPGKPVVFIAEPSGRISHASRSFQRTVNDRRVVDEPVRVKMNAAMRRFCKLQDIPLDDVAVTEYLPTEEELRSRSLGTAAKELESIPEAVETSPETDEQVSTEEEPTEPPQQGGLAAMSVLTYATAFVEAELNTRAAPPPAPKATRYDAIRDVFTDSKPAPAPAAAETNSLNLNFLAELCNVETRLQEPEGSIVKTRAPHVAVPEAESEMRVHREDVPPVAPPMSQVPINAQHAPLEPAQEQHQAYYSYNGYAVPEPPRDVPMGAIRPIDPLYAGGRMAHYGPEGTMLAPASAPVQAPPPPVPAAGYAHYWSQQAPPPPPAALAPAPAPSPAAVQAQAPPAPGPGTPYSHGYWSQQPPPPGAQLPPPSPAMAQAQGPPPPQQQQQHPQHQQQQHPQHQQHYPQPPPPRMPFSAEPLPPQPLPPLRPPRGRSQPVQDDMLRDPMMRPAPHGMNNYYPPGPPRPYHYPTPEPLAPMPPLAQERILPAPQPQQSYMGPSGPGYAPQMPSPTFGHPQPMSGPMGQSPPGTPQGVPGSMHRHRSTPSGSSDAGTGKYRKLQPAPVPAHRTWSSKPELKTIPYDHKETGASAALPKSGPTQIRGWNATTSHPTPPHPNWSVRFAEPHTIHLPPLFPRVTTPARPRTMADDLDLYPTPPIPDGNATVSVEQAAAPADPAPAGPSPAEPAPVDDPVSENGTTASRRLRPRRAKTPASTTAPTPSPQPTTPGRRARKPSRTASKKKTARKGAALASIQAQPQPPAEGAS
ncbi:hypothetical protein BBK36DRAFT_156196 [Trichoderma citrinoviride]|uniref:Uncharacterized protein n=1 Tax=Trichoderma citrinoviride TaxID=58853 RepID=A0A2T4BEV4_9HYPO|nr:hypothetical protein BBK36DRAFT_156196 [Trichoderma citrinoviride]PTB67835.1 hypothetical protein BBK36DRAFT_156196 [Trichoderma citrinoviride]